MKTDYILDSSVWVSFFNDKDVHHKWALFLVEDIMENQSTVIIPEIILIETLYNLQKLVPSQQLQHFKDYWKENDLIAFYFGGLDFYFDYAPELGKEIKLKTHDFIIYAYSRFFDAELITFDKKLKKIFQKSK